MKIAMKQYQAVGAHGAVQDADPHRLTQMLFHGALDRIHAARGCMERGDRAGKADQINRAVKVVGGLQGAIDMDAGQLSENLDALYEYVARRLLEANARDEVAGLDEAAELIGAISEAWDQVAQEVRGVRPRALPA